MSTPDAETVPEWLVPYIEALREAIDLNGPIYGMELALANVTRAARALVDAASESNRRNADNRHAVERSTAGEDEHREDCPLSGVNVGVPCSVCAPADPVSEARCRCGHPRERHRNNYRSCADCESDCQRFTPAPPPTTPRGELADAERGEP